MSPSITVQPLILVAISTAWRRYERTRVLPAYWPELAPLSDVERAAVKQLLRDACVWNAAAPRFTTDGRRIS